MRSIPAFRPSLFDGKVCPSCQQWKPLDRFSSTDTCLDCAVLPRRFVSPQPVIPIRAEVTVSHSSVRHRRRRSPFRLMLVAPGEWHCLTCDQIKPSSEFNHAAKGAHGLFFECRDCATARQRRVWHTRVDVREQSAHRSRLHRYGITAEEFDAMLDAQHGCCAACGDELQIGKQTHVDHDHETGTVRALLCGNCNVMIGQAKDDPDRLRRAALYLEHYKPSS